MADKILEKDISKFRYKDVLGTEHEPKIVIIRYSAIEAAYLFVDIDEFVDDPAYSRYDVHAHPLVKTMNKWLLVDKYQYFWGRVNKIVEANVEKD